MTAPPQTPALAAAQAGFAAARAARARGPRWDLDILRSAYLELLKLCLCDLAGSSTVSVGRTPDGLVMSREIAGDQLRLRSAGMDWPLQGLTMVGLGRLDDLQDCVESVVHDGIEGDLIETGCWRGGASILMRATLDSLGAEDRTVWVADSFRGFPTGDHVHATDDDLSVFDFLAVSLAEVQANFARLGCDRGVRFLPGFFEETIPGLAEERWAIVRLDGDTYDATRLTLESLYPRLAVGGYLIVDDYGALDECRHAVDEFRRENRIEEPLENVDWTCVRWRRESEAPTEGPDPVRARTSPSDRRRSAQPVARTSERHVPSIPELELGRQLGELRVRAAAAEAEIGRLRRHPLRGPRAWLGDKLGRSATG